MSLIGSIFKNQSPWGSSGSSGGSGNGSGSRREPPNIDELIRNIQNKINKFMPGGKSGGGKPIILGLIDNMSFFKGDDGKEYKIFGEGGVEKTAKEFNKEFLGHLPLHQDLRNSADIGEPLTYSQPDHEVSKLFKNIAEKIKQSFR